jgi:hypothetical protein
MPTTDPYVEYVEEFNHDLKVLVQDLTTRYPSDATIYRANKRTMAVIAMDPLFVIESVGPYLLQYRAQIYELETNSSGVVAFFMDNTYDSELKASVKSEKADLVKYIIPKAKECMRSLGDEGRKPYIDLVVRLLDNYIEYKVAREAPAQ